MSRCQFSKEILCDDEHWKTWESHWFHNKLRMYYFLAVLSWLCVCENVFTAHPWEPFFVVIKALSFTPISNIMFGNCFSRIQNRTDKPTLSSFIILGRIQVNLCSQNSFPQSAARQRPCKRCGNKGRASLFDLTQAYFHLSEY